MSVLNILNMLHNLRFFSSKCLLFHNATLFGFCIIHILNTGCAKNWKKKFGAKWLTILGQQNTITLIDKNYKPTTTRSTESKNLPAAKHGADAVLFFLPYPKLRDFQLVKTVQSISQVSS
jgi:hypothetical protein